MATQAGAQLEDLTPGGLSQSYLFVQGPPGSGKTWSGARAALALMQAGRRVGVTALSHKAIHKFLDDLEDAALEAGYEFRGRKKGSGEGRYENRFVDCTNSNEAMLDDELQLLAGTSWLFARAELDQHVDALFVDEGGQFALADAIAVGTAARKLVLLGDRTSSPRSRRARTHPARRRRCSAISSARTRPCRPTAGSFSSTRGACGRR
jgi:AAA domain